MAEKRDPGISSLKEIALRRLLAVKATGPVPDEYVAMAARGVGVHKRTVWRRLDAAEKGVATQPRGLAVTP